MRIRTRTRIRSDRRHEFDQPDDCTSSSKSAMKSAILIDASSATQEKILPTLAEQWLQEGRAEGLAKGRADGLREMLGRQLATKFGALTPEQQARLDGATVDELERFVDRVIPADSIAAVLGS